MATNNKKARRSKPPQQKLEWKDALAAIAAKEEQHQRFAKRWGQMYRQARTDIQSEEAVVFLGEDARRILGMNPPTDDNRTPPPALQPPDKATTILSCTAALVALAGYALSLWRVSRVI